MGAPLVFRWDGEQMIPLIHCRKAADATYVIGQAYTMVEQEQRSQRSHNHYFACVHDAWLNLPDAMAVEFANDTLLRKHALIMTGYREERKFAASSPVEARKIAAFIKPRDEYAIVSVAGPVVVEWTAKSQSRKEMGKEIFQKSKDDVLEFVASLIGVKAEELSARQSSQEPSARAA